jgi:hypothetical protein
LDLFERDGLTEREEKRERDREKEMTCGRLGGWNMS